MQFPNVHICAILSNDRINDEAVKTLITKDAQEWDVVDPGGPRKQRLSREYISWASFIF